MGGDVLLFLAGCAAVYAVWPLRNLAAVGNPVYPASDRPVPFARVVACTDRRFFPEMPTRCPRCCTPGGTWLRSFRPSRSSRVPGSPASGPRSGVALIGGAVFLFRRKLSPGWSFLRNAVVVFVVIWFLTSWFSRFLLPVLPLMALLYRDR